MPKSEPSVSPLVIFDLDGTLVETGPDLVASLNHSIATIGLAPFEMEDVGHLVGQGARTMILRALDERGIGPSEDVVSALLASFLSYYEATMPGRSAPYPGLLQALDALTAEGMKLAVCTNKSETLARRLLEELDIARRFAAVTGGDTFPVRKPDPAHILGTIERAGADRDNCVMIGDSINDILAASGAGVGSVAVSFGYSDRPAAELGASVLIDRYEQLTPALVRELISRTAMQKARNGGRDRD